MSGRPGRGAEECGAAGRRKVLDMKKIVVFTGAGVSADSGLATFRDADGLWADYRIEEVCTPEALARNRALVVGFYNERRREMLAARRTPRTRPSRGWSGPARSRW